MAEETQSQGPTDINTDDAANVVTSTEETQSNDANSNVAGTSVTPEKEMSFHDTVKNRGQKAHEKSHGKKEPDGATKEKNAEPKPTDQQTPPEAPKFEPNFKYKAFGKEKELDPLFRDLIKDADTEKKVKEVFTRADAFDDMKTRYEAASKQMQTISGQHQELDKDVKRVMHFRNSGDLDNFFASVQLPKQDIYNWVARQLELEKASPDQQAAYNQGVQARAENLYNQQNYASIQAQFAEQRAEMVKMQLDHNLMRPEIQGAASAYDQRMGEGSFRQVVIDEAAFHTYATQGREIWSPDQAIAHVMQKFGKLLENPQPQATAQGQMQAPQNQHQQMPQATQTVQVQGKPVIPNVNGRGTSPVKQAPKTLDDLKKLGAQMRAQEAQAYESNY